MLLFIQIYGFIAECTLELWRQSLIFSASITNLYNLRGEKNVDAASVLRESIFLNKIFCNRKRQIYNVMEYCFCFPPSILTQNNQQHNLKEQKRKGKTWREKPWSWMDKQRPFTKIEIVFCKLESQGTWIAQEISLSQTKQRLNVYLVCTRG